MEDFVQNRFGAFLGRMLTKRYTVLAASIALLMGFGGYVSSGRLGLEMFPSVESDYAYGEATLSSDIQLKPTMS